MERVASDALLATDSEGRLPSPGLARDLSELAREMQSQPNSAAVLDRIVTAAVVEISGTDAAGITISTQGQLSTAASTDPVVDELDQIQCRTEQGPCVQTSWQHQTVRSDDLADEPRWPEFARQASALGFGSILSVQLWVVADSFGALNLYAGKPHAFDRDAENTALLFGAHAAVAMAASRKEENLRIALASREMIGEAKGILMERYKIRSQQAFDLLISASQRTHRKLRDVADDLTRTGELPSATR